MARITQCPHCGKELSNPEKLAWHLSRECPVMLKQTADEQANADARRPAAANEAAR